MSSPPLERRLLDHDTTEVPYYLLSRHSRIQEESTFCPEKIFEHGNSDHDAAATADLTLDDDDDEEEESTHHIENVMIAREDKVETQDVESVNLTSTHSPIKSSQKGLPDMYWLNMPEQWTIKEDKDGNKHLKITCPEEVDFWRHTLHGFIKDDGPFYWRFVYGDFEARLTIKGKFHYLYDMAGIMVRQNEDHWMTCGVTNFQDNLQSRYHKHQAKHLYVSSTFTRGKSDWSTHRAMQKKRHKSSVFHVWVRRIADVMECYYSLDNDLWIKVREGVLAPGVRKLRVGMVCTAPESAGFTVTFSNFMVRYGEKSPEDDIENLVYKTNGTKFVGMIEKNKVDMMREKAKRRMLKSVAEEKTLTSGKKHDASLRKVAQETCNPPSSVRSFHQVDNCCDVIEHHTRVKTAAVAPTRRPAVASVKSKKPLTPNCHVIQASNPAREIPKQRPTNPYAVVSPPREIKSHFPTEDSQTPTAEEKFPPPPIKVPMRNPYAVPPPEPNSRTNSFPGKVTPSSNKAQASRHSVASTDELSSVPRERPRNEISGKTLRRADVMEPTGRMSKLSVHLGNPLGTKSDIGRRPLSNHPGHPARSKSDTGPSRRSPPPQDGEREKPARRKSWWSLGIKQRKKSHEKEPKRQLPRTGILRRNRSRDENPSPRFPPDPEPTRQQSNPAGKKVVQERPNRHPKRSKPTMPQRRPSDDIDEISFFDEELPPEDSPPKRPERQPSMEDDTALFPSDDDGPPMEGAEACPKDKLKKKKIGKSDTSCSTDSLGSAKKKKKKKKKETVSLLQENGQNPDNSKKSMKKKSKKKSKMKDCMGSNDE